MKYTKCQNVNYGMPSITPNEQKQTMKSFKRIISTLAVKTETTGTYSFAWHFSWPIILKVYVSTDLENFRLHNALRSIMIGGTTTGINSIETGEAENEVYFDLQGRRVNSPKKGLYITSQGKKVIFN